MSRTISKPTPFDPRNPRQSAAAQGTSPADPNYTEWSFYETDSYYVTKDLIGRADYNPSQRANYIYLGRKTTKNVSVIKFSNYEGQRILNLVSQCLDEIKVHGTWEDKLIPMLEGKPGARETLTRDNKPTYFDSSQVMLQNVRARLCFCMVQGCFMLHLLSPVSQEISNKMKGWIGPTASLNVEDMQMLEGFLQAALSERE